MIDRADINQQGDNLSSQYLHVTLNVLRHELVFQSEDGVVNNLKGEETLVKQKSIVIILKIAERATVELIPVTYSHIQMVI